jgi:hypothetical protein
LLTLTSNPPSVRYEMKVRLCLSFGVGAAPRVFGGCNPFTTVIASRIMLGDQPLDLLC